MAVHNPNLLPYHNVPEDGKEGKDCRESRVAVHNQKGDVVDLKTVGEVSDPIAVVVGVGYDDDFVAAVYELGSQLVHVRFNTAGLWKEEVADHGDVVGGARGRRAGGGRAMIQGARGRLPIQGEVGDQGLIGSCGGEGRCHCDIAVISSDGEGMATVRLLMSTS